MKKKSILYATVISTLLAATAMLLHSPALAKEVLRYSSSAQIREALGDEGLNAFIEEAGVEVDLWVGSSSAAVHRLMNDFSDLASTTERLSHRSEEYGYVEIFFAMAPLVVITNVKTPVRDVSSDQLRDIFNGTITNWKELGGPDEEIIVIVPEKGTGAYKNFEQLALKRFDIKYDFMAYRSTDVVKLVHRVPWSISFISQGAHTAKEAIKILTINGTPPENPSYVYFQVFSFVTKGQPQGAAKKLIDFAFSEKAKNIMRKNGIKPLPREGK